MYCYKRPVFQDFNGTINLTFLLSKTANTEGFVNELTHATHVFLDTFCNLNEHCLLFKVLNHIKNTILVQLHLLPSRTSILNHSLSDMNMILNAIKFSADRFHISGF